MRTSIVLVALLAVFALVLADDEVNYKGKPASYWAKQIEEGDPAGRLAAVRAMRAFGPSVDGAVAALAKALGDTSVDVRIEAASALADLGPAAAPAVEALAKSLRDARAEVRLRAATALGKIGQPAVGAFPALADLLDDADPTVQAATCAAIETLPIEAKDRAAVATRAARSKSPAVRAWGLKQVVALGAEAKDAEPLLIDALGDEDIMTRRRAAEALGRIGASEKAIPALTHALADKDASVVGAATAALATFGDKAVPALLELLQQDEGNTWQLASCALAEMGAQSGSIVPELLKMLRDRDEGFRKRGVATLLRMGERGRKVLEKARTDKDELVAKAAEQALAGTAKTAPYRARIADAKLNLVARGGGTRASEATVTAALWWLARHQAPDGHWKAAGFEECCSGMKCGGPGYEDYDVGETGLALLAFLGAGYGMDSHAAVKDGPEFGLVVTRAIDYLMAVQQADGGFDAKHASKRMYNDAIATYALAEAYGVTGDEAVGVAAQKAVNFLEAAQNPNAVWRYTPRSGDNDTSVTGWCVMALEAAQMAGLEVDGRVRANAWAFVKGVTDQNYAKVGYQTIEDAGVKVVVPGKNEDYAQHEAMAAIGMLVRSFLAGDRRDPLLEMGARLLAGDLPEWDGARKTTDYYYWYYGTMALFQFDGPGSGGTQKYWKPWNQAVVNAIVKNQNTRDAGCADGSWDPDDRWGFEGGRVYATALNALTLEVYYRYPNVFAKPK